MSSLTPSSRLCGAGLISKLPRSDFAAAVDWKCYSLYCAILKCWSHVDRGTTRDRKYDLHVYITLAAACFGGLFTACLLSILVP